jgi:hypothetical protein
LPDDAIAPATTGANAPTTKETTPGSTPTGTPATPVTAAASVNSSSSNLNVMLALPALRKLCRTSTAAPVPTPPLAANVSATTGSGNAGNPTANQPTTPTAPRSTVSPASRLRERLGSSNDAANAAANATAHSYAVGATSPPHGAQTTAAAATPASLLFVPIVERRVNRETQRLARNVGAHTQVRTNAMAA